MNNRVTQSVGICDVLKSPSIDLQASDNNIYDADTDNEERDANIYNYGAIGNFFFMKIDGELKVIYCSNMIDKEKEADFNKANTLLPEAANDDAAEYITPPLTFEDFNLDFNNSDILISEIQDIKGDSIEVDAKEKTPEQKFRIQNESPQKKRKLHEISEPLSNESDEKRRIGAINAKKNREKNKAIVDHLNEELSKEKEKNRSLEYQLKNEQNATKIAILKKQNSDLKYQLLLDKYERLTENK